MTIRRLAIVLALTTAAAIMVPSAIAATKPPKLSATFGAGLTFDVKKGKRLLSTGSDGAMTLKASTYRLQLDDNSSSHNFRLENSSGKTIKGTKAAKNTKVLTSVPGVSSKIETFVIDLKPGKYKLLCSPHKNVGMTVEITVS